MDTPYRNGRFEVGAKTVVIAVLYTVLTGVAYVAYLLATYDSHGYVSHSEEKFLGVMGLVIGGFLGILLVRAVWEVYRSENVWTWKKFAKAYHIYFWVALFRSRKKRRRRARRAHP